MTGAEAAEIAFRKCKSRNPKKNQASAPYIARLLLVAHGLRGVELQQAAADAEGALDAMFGHSINIERGTILMVPDCEEA